MKKKQKIPMLIMILILGLIMTIMGGLFSLVKLPGFHESLGIRGFGTLGTIIVVSIYSLISIAIIYGSIKAKKWAYFLTIGFGTLFILGSAIDLTMTRGEVDILLGFMSMPEELSNLYSQETLIIIGRFAQIAQAVGGSIIILFAYLKRSHYNKKGLI